MKLKKSKKYMDGGPLQPKPKKKAVVDSVESEMNPGKKIPASAVRKGSYITKSAPKKKMKDGGKSFPDLNKDGKVTKADILVGRGVIKAKTGAALKKQAATAIAMKKAGKAPKKAMGGMKMMKGGGKCKYGC